MKSELYLFDVPPMQTSIDDGRRVEHQPLTSLDSGGPIEFMLPGTGDAYLLVMTLAKASSASI